MAKLKAGTTVGGKAIVTMDYLNKFISNDQIDDWSNKMNKYEKKNLTSFDIIAQNSINNGVYNVNGLSPGSGIYSYGTCLNLATENFGLQLYAPEKDNESKEPTAALFFRTRVDNTLRTWQRIVTESMLNTKINTRLPLTGGKLSGILTSTSVFRTTGNVFFGVTPSMYKIDEALPAITLALGDKDTGFNWISDGSFNIYSNNEIVGNINSAGINFPKKLQVKSNDVWHAGNFNPETKISKSTLLTEKTDLNTVIQEGIYRIYLATNRPSRITGWLYVHVTRHDDSYILQRVYNYEGTLAYWRTKAYGKWQKWQPLGGAMTAMKNITSQSEWTQDTNVNSVTNGVYYITVTHGLESLNIVSVTLTNSSNVSMQRGYEIIDANKIKVWCEENPLGKIIINAIP